ncbi:MAG: G5 domain-containing protein [Anaerolineales bacterium]|jgi:hypothetical protein
MRPLSKGLISILILMPIGLAACRGPQTTTASITVEISVDGDRRQVDLPSGSTVQQALQQSGISLGELDRLDPPSYTVVYEDAQIRVTRVTERFEVEAVVVPFERQTIRSESIAEGETRLLQPGRNGMEEITYRIVEEEGVEQSRTPVKRTVLQEAEPEIIMIGTLATYTQVSIEGALAYLSGGNAWLMQIDSGNRRPLYVGGDLDGRVFKLSPDGRWLLFSRQEAGDEAVNNSLWVVSTLEDEAEPFDLQARNVIHFADWFPGAQSPTIAYSTVEPRAAAPGWQANNDLILVTFDPEQDEVETQTLIEPNAGGEYGWWGTTFAWSPDGTMLAYARPDGVGVVDLVEPTFTPWFAMAPYQSLADWAWVPGIAWGQDSATLFAVDHGAPVGLEEAAASPVFNLVALTDAGAQAITLASRTGMFSHPSTSPLVDLPSGERAYSVAYLQAITPLESESSSYRLVVMDRDGSNNQVLFPADGDPGLEPQQVVWSPGGNRIALLYRGDLWIIDLASAIGQRLTGDGLATGLDWK